MSVRLDEIDLSSHDAFVDEVPLWAFRELRARDPVHWQPEPTPNRGFWAITRSTTSRTSFATRRASPPPEG